MFVQRRRPAGGQETGLYFRHLQDSRDRFAHAHQFLLALQTRHELAHAFIGHVSSVRPHVVRGRGQVIPVFKHVTVRCVRLSV